MYVLLSMLKIQYCSDLHLEFPENILFLKKHPVEPIGDILILAGDIVPFAVINKFDSFFDEMSEKFEQVYWIPGNHEYYHSDIRNRTGSVYEEIRNNIFLVNNQEIQIQNTKLILSTLWSSISESNEWEVTQRLSDFLVINRGGRKFTSSDYKNLYQQNIEFLQKTLKETKENESVIVVTHHVPTFQNYPEKYKGDVLSEAFAVELFDFIESSSANYWIFGHHHYNINPFKIGNTQLLTNQLGYVRYGENKNYSSSSFIAG